MADKIIENNQVSIMGAIASEFEKSHEVYGEGFYMVDVLVKRLSGSEDRIPLMVSERLVDICYVFCTFFEVFSSSRRMANRCSRCKIFCMELTFLKSHGFKVSV